MSRKFDINEKAKEIEDILIKYGGLPSQVVDKPAYALVRYFFTNYSDNPIIS